MTSYIYDVALSFAGEDREYVKLIADSLRLNGIRVFYDEYETSNLWGKELIEYLEDIYKNKSKYVIIFVSKSYLIKEWTNHERKSALNRAIKEKEEYILPVRLDDSKIPGLHDSIGYLSAEKISANDLCDLFMKKIKRDNIGDIKPAFSLYRLIYRHWISWQPKKWRTKEIMGLGAKSGGRWNNKEHKVFYTSSSEYLASIEVLKYLNLNSLSSNEFVYQEYIIPASTTITKIYESDLPHDWNEQPISIKTQSIGNSWLEKNETCILSVPSVIIPNERNYLINPAHNDFKQMTLIEK